ncbi:MAG: hypothetical protein RIC56_21085 [Pseudomonadales bacterium]
MMDWRGLTVVLAVAAGARAFAVEPTAPVVCDFGAPDPAAPVELNQFGFLIGNYRIHLHAWQGDGWSPPSPGVTARWNGRYGLRGMAIYDEWFNPDPAQDPGGNRGVNVRLYDPQEQLWKMMWIATSGKVVQDLRARMEDGTLTMWQVAPERPDFKAVFNIHDADHWDRVSFTHDASGDWVPQYKLAATRIPCEPAP